MRLCGFLLLLFLLTCAASARNRSRRGPRGSRHRGAHHRPLTDAQKTDQNLQFMLSLYRGAAGPDGTPKQHRKFRSNTVRLLRPSASTVRYLPATRDHHVSFTVQYNLDTLPSEQLVKASFIHLRSGAPPGAPRGAPRCRARLSALGPQSLVVLEPHERWTETDITAHVLRDATPHLTLTAHYWCSRHEDPAADPAAAGQRHAETAREPQVEVPALLLYLQEERRVNDWMGELLGRRGHDFVSQLRRGRPAAVRRRRSKGENGTSDALAKAPTTASSSTTAASSTTASSSLLSDLPTYKRKTGMPKNRCRLHSFRLSFDQLGWGHYFIAPPTYNPRFCRGDCPQLLPYGYNSPNHAIVQNTIQELGLGDVPAAACVPFRYLPLSVLVVHKTRVEYRELEDMVAESCTCR